MTDRIAHIGIAVKDLESAIEAFSDLLNCPPDHKEEVTDQKVQTAMFKVGQSKLELLEGTSPDSAISKYIEKRGPGIHHICLEVDDIEKELERLKQNGASLIDEKPRIGVGGRKIAFVHPRSTAGILIELQQKE